MSTIDMHTHMHTQNKELLFQSTQIRENRAMDPSTGSFAYLLHIYPYFFLHTILTVHI